MAAMAPGAAPKIQIPRWMQLVGLPLLLILAWVVAGRVFHVVFLFLVAALIALLLDPVVKAIGAMRIGRFRIRRGFAVATRVPGLRGGVDREPSGLSPPSSSIRRRRPQTGSTPTLRSPMDRPARPTPTADVDRLQQWLNHHGLSSIDVQQRGHRWVRQIRDKDVGKYTSRVVNFVEGAAISIGKLLFASIVVIVVSIYMLLDFSRARPRARPALPAASGLGAAARADGARGRRLREGPGCSSR